MITILKTTYMLLLSYNPCDIFTYYNVTEMHGLSIAECQNYNNSSKNAYIAGLSNFVPKESEEYNKNDKRFVFINLSRCGNDVETMGLIMHEMMHHSFFIHNYDVNKEEEIITWAENESYELFNLIKKQNEHEN
jgi:hypothetical protein